LDLATDKILGELADFSKTSRSRIVRELIWRVKAGVAPPLKILPRGRPKTRDQKPHKKLLIGRPKKSNKYIYTNKIVDSMGKKQGVAGQTTTEEQMPYISKQKEANQ